MEKKDQVLICPHCGNETPQRFIGEAVGKEEVIPIPEGALSPGSPPDAYDVQTYYFFVQCRTCLQPSIYWDWEENPGAGDDLRQATVIFPGGKAIYGIPKAIEDIYTEAKRIKKAAPTAFAILIRKGLEYICKDQKASGSSLKEQL